MLVILKIVADPGGASYFIQVAFDHNRCVSKILSGFDLENVLGISEVGQFYVKLQVEKQGLFAGKIKLSDPFFIRVVTVQLGNSMEPLAGIIICELQLRSPT